MDWSRLKLVGTNTVARTIIGRVAARNVRVESNSPVNRMENSTGWRPKADSVDRPGGPDHAGSGDVAFLWSLCENAQFGRCSTTAGLFTFGVQRSSTSEASTQSATSGHQAVAPTAATALVEQLKALEKIRGLSALTHLILISS